jgi:CDP-diacylglycerol pyrophosphatase
MDLTTQYCPIRRNLEKRNWNLVSRWSSLSVGLIGSAGRDYRAFNAASAKCKKARVEIRELRKQLEAHRAEHGC